jgi:hypothetical protein
METASRRQSATTGVLTGVGFDWERGNFRRGRSSHMTKWDVHHAGLARYRQGVAGYRSPVNRETAFRHQQLASG